MTAEEEMTEMGSNNKRMEPVGTPEQRQRARELTIGLVQKYDRRCTKCGREPVAIGIPVFRNPAVE
jgi:hypothetical protein